MEDLFQSQPKLNTLKKSNWTNLFSTVFFVIIICLVTSNEGMAKSESPWAGYPQGLEKSDFNVRRNPFLKFLNSKNQVFSIAEPTPELCRQKISEVICVVNPAKKGEDVDARPCLNSSHEQTTLVYAQVFEQLFDHYPWALQKLFCSVQRIFIEKDFFGTAYATGLTDPNGKFNGAIIGIRQSVLDEKLSLSTWASWKEQLSFGGVKNSYQLTPGLPNVYTSTPNKQINDFLYFVVSHELGHVLDFAHKLNKVENCSVTKDPDEYPVCDFAPESWGAISWKNNQQPKDINDFPLRKNLCFYSCEKPMSKNDINTLYSDLWKTTYISTYAATNPYDDFADSFAYYLMSDRLEFSYVIDTNQGMFFDPLYKLSGVTFSEKYNFIKKFLTELE